VADNVRRHKFGLVKSTDFYAARPPSQRGGQNAISEALLPEFDQEMSNTRKTLERVPDEKFDWNASEHNAPMGNLANHLAMLPNWGSITVNTDSARSRTAGWLGIS